ncbi:hypothetical protein [Candidatus Poriferisodalis sp.]|uniref:hypothetical protein n=1 Tax=Candidatus Poriferisodalis sp. TaxID=3101277 RepID=UPI003AF43FEA
MTATSSKCPDHERVGEHLAVGDNGGTTEARHDASGAEATGHRGREAVRVRLSDQVDLDIGQVRAGFIRVIQSGSFVR